MTTFSDGAPLVSMPATGVALVTLNRPNVLNALRHSDLLALLDFCVEFEGDSAIRAVVITGAGRAFCAGGDVRALRRLDASETEPYLRVYSELAEAMSDLRVPVIAAGGIADGRGIAAAFALGAAGVQIGTAYLHTPESKVTDGGRKALADASDDSTVITNVMTGRPARGVANRLMKEVGPVSPDAPAFPHAATALVPLKAAAEKLGRTDFTNLWAGQAVAMHRDLGAAELTRQLAAEALYCLKKLAR